MNDNKQSIKDFIQYLESIQYKYNQENNQRKLIQINKLIQLNELIISEFLDYISSSKFSTNKKISTKYDEIYYYYKCFIIIIKK